MIDVVIVGEVQVIDESLGLKFFLGEIVYK